MKIFKIVILTLIFLLNENIYSQDVNKNNSDLIYIYNEDLVDEVVDIIFSNIYNDKEGLWIKSKFLQSFQKNHFLDKTNYSFKGLCVFLIAERKILNGTFFASPSNKLDRFGLEDLYVHFWARYPEKCNLSNNMKYDIVIEIYDKSILFKS